MAKKKTPRSAPASTPPTPPLAPLSDDLTTAEILAATPKKPRRGRKREAAKSLGVYDADRDILDQYLHEVSQTPLLTQPQEIAIARKVRTGDEEAMQELVKRNLRFVISVAKKYQNRGLALTDLIGEGNVGLLTAARKFDPDQGVKFISYAVWWIEVRLDAPLDPEGDRSFMDRFIADDQADAESQAMDQFLSEEIERALRTLPARDAKVLRLYFGLDGGREHTLEEIGAMLGVTRERVRQLRDRALKRLREGDVGRALASFAA